MNICYTLALTWNPAVGIPLLIVSLIVLGLLWLFGQPGKTQGTRRDPDRVQSAAAPHDSTAATVSESAAKPAAPRQGELDMDLREELARLEATLSGERAALKTAAQDPASPVPGRTLSAAAAAVLQTLRAPANATDRVAAPPDSEPGTAAMASHAPAAAAPGDLGRRTAQWPIERIVSLFVVARQGQVFHGTDLVVAAEKVGLIYGDMSIYHRMLDGQPEAGPLFSVANMIKPGNFDLSHIDKLQTPGLSFFMTLPAPIPALDAWETMLPTAQRLAELLDAQVLDEERNALGRQRIAHIRDELRAWDRQHEGERMR